MSSKPESALRSYGCMRRCIYSVLIGLLSVTVCVIYTPVHWRPPYRSHLRDMKNKQNDILKIQVSQQ